jgi:hypothetical protein
LELDSYLVPKFFTVIASSLREQGTTAAFH